VGNKCKENIKYKIGVASGKFIVVSYYYTAKNLKRKTIIQNSKSFCMVLM
jgi:hypothetical protein